MALTLNTDHHIDNKAVAKSALTKKSLSGSQSLARFPHRGWGPRAIRPLHILDINSGQLGAPGESIPFSKDIHP